MAKEGAHLIVTGIVQGVGYRAWAQRTAKELSLTGWVRNLLDGRVELAVEGEKKKLDDFIHRAKKGPPTARVDNLQVRRTAALGVADFTTRPTAIQPEEHT